MKLALKIIGLLLLVLIIAGGALYYLSQPRVVSSSTQKTAYCVNPIGKNVFEANETKYKKGGNEGNSSQMDTCDFFANGEFSRSGLLNEYYCENGSFVNDKIDCGIGSVCRNGRCMKGLEEWPICNDSDNGIDPKKRGSTGSSGMAMDECFVSTNKSNPEVGGSSTDKCVGESCYVYEYYCQGDERLNKIIPSANGCENGVAK